MTRVPTSSLDIIIVSWHTFNVQGAAASTVCPPACLVQYMPGKVWGVITYFTLHFMIDVITYPWKGLLVDFLKINWMKMCTNTQALTL